MSTIEVRSPSRDPHQYTGWTSHSYVASNGSLRLNADAGKQITAPLDLLTPGRRYTVTARLQTTPATTGAKTYAVLDGVSKEISTSAYTNVSWTVTGDRPVSLVVSGVNTLYVNYLDITAEHPAPGRSLLPGDVLSLELSVPRPENTVLRLNQSRLGAAALNRGTVWPGVMTLGTGKLGTAYLTPPDIQEWWTPVLPMARSVATTRGSSGVLVPKAQLGTLAAEFPNNLDPRAYGIRKGTPVRLYHWPSRTLIWSGQVSRAVVNPERPGRRLRYVTELEAVDAVSQLVGITRYGAIPQGSEATGGLGRSETWTQRAARLMESAPGIPWRIAPAAGNPATPAMGATVLETSLAAHLDVLAASAAGCWWIDPAGTVVLCPGRPGGEPVAEFTDEAGPASALPWPYIDALAGWDSTEVVSAVTVKNHRAEFDGERGEWTEANTETEVLNPTLAATYGDNPRDVETALYDPDGAAAQALGERFTRGQTSAAAVTSVTVNALADDARAAGLDLFQPVRAALRGETRDADVMTVSHTIDPYAWSTQAALIERTP